MPAFLQRSEDGVQESGQQRQDQRERVASFSALNADQPVCQSKRQRMWRRKKGASPPAFGLPPEFIWQDEGGIIRLRAP